MNRKGFPESYDTRRLLAFLREIKSGDDVVEAPVYSHVVYDIVDGERVVVSRPDIVILEGLNVLQVGNRSPTEFVSDYFDFSIYIDADEDDIERVVRRAVPHPARRRCSRTPTASSGTSPSSTTTRRSTRPAASGTSINGRNLRENIAPTRERASLIVRKGGDHRVDRVRLRRL